MTDEPEDDQLELYMNESPVNVAPSFVYFLSNLSNQELGVIANLATFILAIRHDITPHEIMKTVAGEDYEPNDEMWEGGVKSYIQTKMIEAASYHEEPTGSD